MRTMNKLPSVANGWNTFRRSDLEWLRLDMHSLVLCSRLGVLKFSHTTKSSKVCKFTNSSIGTSEAAAAQLAEHARRELRDIMRQLLCKCREGFARMLRAEARVRLDRVSALDPRA